MAPHETTRIGKHVYVRECETLPDRKTKRWWVVADAGEVELGQVKWFGKWRCYAYFPLNDTLYEKVCLRDIAQFCEDQTMLQKQKPGYPGSPAPKEKE